MDKTSVMEIVLQIINDNKDMLGLTDIDKNTPLFGESSTIDSIQLITLIGRIEDHFLDNHDTDLNMVTEDTFSRGVSPFSSIENLADYLLEILPLSKPA